MLQPFLSAGFRPFFLAASIWSTVVMAVWTGVLQGWLSPEAISYGRYGASMWHAHEMIFGFAMAAATGFLLTAVPNWTQVPTLQGKPLAALVCLWLSGRILPFTHLPVGVGAACDLAFMTAATLAIAAPIAKSRSKNNYAIAGKLILLTAADASYFIALFKQSVSGMQAAQYSALFLLVALVLTIGRRVMPFFIQRAAPESKTLATYRWLDFSSLYSFLLFWVTETFYFNSLAGTYLAALLSALHITRLITWYRPHIWKHSLLWILYLGYAGLTAGFVFRTLSGFNLVSPMLAIHAYTVAGVGCMTLGMMARISLGHTGRDVYSPPWLLNLLFMLLLMSFTLRVLMPLVLPGLYPSLLLMSQIGWIASFAGFAILYTPMWLQPRADA